MLPPCITILTFPRFLIIALAIFRSVQILGVEVCRIEISRAFKRSLQSENRDKTHTFRSRIIQLGILLGQRLRFRFRRHFLLSCCIVEKSQTGRNYFIFFSAENKKIGMRYRINQPYLVIPYALWGSCSWR